MELSELEYDILDEAYFVTSYQNIIKNISATPGEIEKTIYNLIKQDLLQQMEYDEESMDYLKKEEPDFQNLAEYKYLASKKGLLLHTTGEC